MTDRGPDRLHRVLLLSSVFRESRTIESRSELIGGSIPGDRRGSPRQRLRGHPLPVNSRRSEAADTTRVCGQPAGVAILSAPHGLLDPDTVIAPYKLTMGQPGACSPELVAAQLRARRPGEIIAMLLAAYLKVLSAAIHLVNEAGMADIALMDAFEAAPGIGYQRGVAASLLRTAGSIGAAPQRRKGEMPPRLI